MRVSSLSLSILLAAILCASSSVVLAQSIASAREDGTNSEKDSEEEELPLAAVRRQDMNGIDQPEDKRNLQSWGMGDLWWRSGKFCFLYLTVSSNCVRLCVPATILDRRYSGPGKLLVVVAIDHLFHLFYVNVGCLVFSFVFYCFFHSIIVIVVVKRKIASEREGRKTQKISLYFESDAPRASS
mmetsp:Transcript_16192/g.39791  ORF Transcript_16192/g.39791 Transcript_16192/m.39791 type:complete len:184 (-) Transcript_16192:189-740(-)